jgi:hypothetical protein
MHENRLAQHVRRLPRADLRKAGQRRHGERNPRVPLAGLADKRGGPVEGRHRVALGELTDPPAARGS